VAQNEESCSTWATSPALTQQGNILHLTQDANGVVHGIAVVDNIWANGRWVFNINAITGNASTPIVPIQNGYDLSAVVGGESGPYTALPWHECARTFAGQVQFVVWTGSNPEPAYGTPGASGSVAIPPGYTQPGQAGWWVGHVAAGSTANFSALATTNLDLNPPPPVITTTWLPSGPLNSPYSQTLAAGNGTAPYAWSITNGTLPAGLVLNAGTGSISGTPTAAGTQVVAITVTDANNLTATVTVPITIAPPAPYSPLVPVRICDSRAGNPSSLDAAPQNQCNGGTGNPGSTLRAEGPRASRWPVSSACRPMPAPSFSTSPW
jgi:hypothetical protein